MRTWIIACTEEERLKLVRMQWIWIGNWEMCSFFRRKSSSSRNPMCENYAAKSRGTSSLKEYTLPSSRTCKQKISILRWFYPRLIENTFKNWLKQNDRHHKGEDLMHNVENHSIKDSIFHFSGETFIDVEKYAARAKGNTKVFLT